MISFVIVNYNTSDLLKDCINNLLKISPDVGSVEIIVVDNGSVDGSAYMVEKEFGTKLKLIKAHNKGLSAAHNLALDASEGDYIFHIGTDVYPTAESVLAIKAYLDDHNDVGMVTPKLVLRDGTLDMDAHRGALTPWVALSHWTGLDKAFPKSKMFNGYNLGYKDMTVPHEIDVCISHFMAVKKEAYIKVGRWDESFFLYGEDLDFCYRVQQAGYKIMYLSNIEVVHYKGAGVGRKSSKDLDNVSKRDFNHLKKIRIESANAMLHYYDKHLKQKYPFFVTWAVHFGIYALGKARLFMYIISGYGY